MGLPAHMNVYEWKRGAYRCRILLCCSPVGRRRDMIVGCQDVQHVPVEYSMESSLGGLTKNNTSGKRQWRFQLGQGTEKWGQSGGNGARSSMRGGKENWAQQTQRRCRADEKQPARTDEMGFKPDETCQTLTNLTIWQTLLMDPCDADDTAAYTADIRLVSVDASPSVTGYSRATQPWESSMDGRDFYMWIVFTPTLPITCHWSFTSFNSANIIILPEVSTYPPPCGYYTAQ